MSGGASEDMGTEEKFETLVEANDILLERVVSCDCLCTSNKTLIISI